MLRKILKDYEWFEKRGDCHKIRRVAKSGWSQTINRKTALADFQNSNSIHFQTAYPVLSSSCLASLSLQANSSLKAVSCWVLKDFFCFLCSSKYDSSVNMGFTYFCKEGRQIVIYNKCQIMYVRRIRLRCRNLQMRSNIMNYANTVQRIVERGYGGEF